MPDSSPFATAHHYRPTATVAYRAATLPRDFGDAAAECRALREAAALFDRSDRGLLCASGGDRCPWLHNLVTNTIKTLSEGDGVYAFAVDVTGRIQFDLNILALADELRLDIDRAALPDACAQLDLRLITEDVTLTDRSAEFARLGCAGVRAAEIAAALGVANLAALADLQYVPLGGAWLTRHDFVGMTGFELGAPVAEAATWWDRLASAGAVPAGLVALDASRIEAGIPWLGRDLDLQTTPLETGQVERAINFNKGCYLGQEVVERMRSRGVLPRRLVRLIADGPVSAELPAMIECADAQVGRLTSAAHHPATGQWLGLGYLKSSVAADADLRCAGVRLACRT